MNNDIIDFIHKVNAAIINPLLKLLFLVALLYFMWGVFVYVKNGDSDSDRATGRIHMFWGIVGMFIMISVFGIINVILGTVGADGRTQTEVNRVLKL